MTAAAVVADELLAVGLGEEEQVEQAGLDGHGQDAQDRDYVVPLSVGSVGGRIHDFVVLSIILAVQLGWLIVLGYWVFS
jgi:hypothetical protein